MLVYSTAWGGGDVRFAARAHLRDDMRHYEGMAGFAPVRALSVMGLAPGTLQAPLQGTGQHLVISAEVVLPRATRRSFSDNQNRSDESFAPPHKSL